MKQEYVWATNSSGEVIKRAREAQELTQAQLAKKCGCSPMHISQIETRMRIPSSQLTILLSENLSLDPSRLLRCAFRERYGDEILDMILREHTPEEEYKIAPELKYIFWAVENLPEEKREQTIRAMEELLKLALV
ncbi:MAG: helix-turn-helix transcriptional regulator [Patescibacteria group bacterium]